MFPSVTFWCGIGSIPPFICAGSPKPLCYISMLLFSTGSFSLQGLSIIQELWDILPALVFLLWWLVMARWVIHRMLWCAPWILGTVLKGWGGLRSTCWGGSLLTDWSWDLQQGWGWRPCLACCFWWTLRETNEISLRMRGSQHHGLLLNSLHIFYITHPSKDYDYYSIKN